MANGQQSTTHDRFQPPAPTQTIQTSRSTNQISASLVQFASKGIEFVAESQNPHFGNSYATLPFILHRVIRPLAEVGISVVQGGTLLTGQFAVTTRLIHTSGEWIETVMPIAPSAKALERDASQAYGSATTYGRRISLLAMLGLAPVDPKERGLLDADDDGNAASGRAPKRRASSKPVAQTEPPDWTTAAELAVLDAAAEGTEFPAPKTGERDVGPCTIVNLSEKAKKSGEPFQRITVDADLGNETSREEDRGSANCFVEEIWLKCAGFADAKTPVIVRAKLSGKYTNLVGVRAASAEELQS